jgi:hypothetical protein
MERMQPDKLCQLNDYVRHLPNINGMRMVCFYIGLSPIAFVMGRSRLRMGQREEALTKRLCRTKQEVLALNRQWICCARSKRRIVNEKTSAQGVWPLLTRGRACREKISAMSTEQTRNVQRVLFCNNGAEFIVKNESLEPKMA